ncbi:MAG TPA: carboxypeptidase regulatory-like domain-containing protein [Gemmatimonas sp.]|nr:carboxypeptidase regulatory-like domain-containing protein [Gemmatimonas sp.]
MRHTAMHPGLHQLIRLATLVIAMAIVSAAVTPEPAHAIPSVRATPASSATTARVVADSGIIRGVVRDDATGAVLPYAVVSVASLGIERFANSEGQFVLQNLRAGTYRLRVRQLGHSPVEIDVTLAAGAVENIVVRMPRITTKLAAMRVSADWECTTPGRPTRESASESAQIFEQIEQNAQRLRLLAESFPFELDVERRIYDTLDDETGRLQSVDTTRLVSSTRTQYVPGKVIVDVVRGITKESAVQLPTLLDFADSTFQRTHCFLFRGTDDSSGTALLRLDFKVSRKIKSPDVNGSVYLDPTTYALRRADIELSDIPRQFKGLYSVRVTTNFVELAPGLPVTGTVNGVNEFSRRGKRTSVTGSLEQHVPIGIRFLKGRPDGK